jgi:acyl-CoA synthetase (AMP-forming)/AMP-acid ligase II
VIYIDKLISTLKTSSPSKPLLRFANKDLSSSQFLELISGAVAYLAQAGIGRQSFVALLAPNRPEAIAIRYAAHLLGSATCYLSSPSSAAARAQLVQEIRPDLLLAFSETEHLLPADLDCRTEILNSPLPGRSTDLTLTCLAEDRDLAVVVSSGGSTGVPKGSCRDFRAYTCAVGGPSGGDRRQLVNGPLAYLSQILVDAALMHGGYVVLRDRFDPADTLAEIQSNGITDLFLVEPQLFDLMDHPDVSSTDLSSLRRLVHIGASAPAALRERASERLGPRLMHTYGASEMGIVSALPPAAYRDDLTSAGRIVDGVGVRLRASDGTFALPGTAGTIEVRSAGMAKGYRNRPDLTAKAFDEGWYYSGDLGRIDESGQLHILGRAADVERIEGAYVTPTDIEDLLCRLSCVRYATVVSDLDRNRRVVAIEAWADRKVDLEQCRTAILQAFPQAVAASVVFVEYGKVPRTEQGKPDRAKILNHAVRSEDCQRMAGA